MKTIEEIINSEIFISEVKKTITELRQKRSNRLEPKHGFVYRRDWYDRMVENNTFNDKYFISNAKQIWEKKSDLNREERSIIKFVIDKGLVAVMAADKNAENDLKKVN